MLKCYFTFFQFGRAWLLKQISKTSSIDLGVSDEEYYTSIIDLLSTQKSDTELQDEVSIKIIHVLLKFINVEYNQ